MVRFFLWCLMAFISTGIPAAQADFIDYPKVKLQLLDKSTARTQTIEASIGQTIEHGSIFIKVQACRKSDPLDKPENAAFIQVWEVPINASESEWIFSGWMFSSSPALSAMDHSVYDVWVLECTGKVEEPVIIPSSELEPIAEDKAQVESSTEADKAIQEDQKIEESVDEDISKDDVATGSEEIPYD